MGGDISADGAPGKGATFTVRLTFLSAPQDLIPVKEDVREKPARRQITAGQSNLDIYRDNEFAPYGNRRPNVLPTLPAPMMAMSMSEAAGLLSRTVHPVVPPHVDYDITPLGRTALPAIEALRDWGISYRHARDGE